MSKLDREHPCYQLHEDLQAAFGDTLREQAALLNAEKRGGDVAQFQTALDNAKQLHSSVSAAYNDCVRKHGNPSD